MSYCRFAWDGSDVYVYPTANGRIECCACSLADGYSAVGDRRGMVMHLELHRQSGHTVPQHAIDRLNAEIAELESCNEGR